MTPIPGTGRTGRGGGRERRGGADKATLARINRQTEERGGEGNNSPAERDSVGIHQTPQWTDGRRSLDDVLGAKIEQQRGRQVNSAKLPLRTSINGSIKEMLSS